MKNVIYILFFIASTFLNAQTQDSDYFTFYKGGEKYLKPVKYVLFDSLQPNTERKKDKQKIYFHIMGESFVHNKNYTVDTCAINFLQKIKLDDPEDLQENAYKYFKKKKQEEERKTNKKLPVLNPVTGFSPYFKVYILEKSNNNKVIKYEVDWIYSSF